MTVTRHSDSSDVVQLGSLVRVTHGTPQDTNQGSLNAQHEPTRVHTGAFTMVNGEAVSRGGVTKYTVGQDAPSNPGSVMATAREVNGQLTVETVPGLAGSRTVIQQALRDGLVRE